MADSPLMTDKELVIVFDFDGVITILDIDWTALRVDISRKLGFEIETFATFFEKSYGTEKFEEVSNLVKEREMNAAREAAPFQDVQKALMLISQSNYVKAHVASMQSVDVLEYFLRRHDLRPRFGKVLGREDGGSKRIQLEKIKAMEETQGKEGSVAKRFILIDDVSRNVEVAKKAGFEAILYRRRNSMESLVDLVSELIRR